MKNKPTDAQFLTALRRLQSAGRTEIRAGELARIMHTDSVTALGAMERLKHKLKSPSHPSAKRQKARVGYALPNRGISNSITVWPNRSWVTDLSGYPVLVLPMPSLRSAQKRKRIENMSEEELVEAIAQMIFVPVGSPKGSTDRIARMAVKVFKGEA